MDKAAFIGSYMAFKDKSDNEVADMDVVIEAVDRRECGTVEISLNLCHAKERLYLKFRLLDLIEAAMKLEASKDNG